MIVFITIIHVLVCAFLIIVVLLQHGQSADIAAAFGGAGSQTAFGARTAGTVLSRATTYAAIAFMLTSITLSVMATRRGVSTDTCWATRSRLRRRRPPHQRPPLRNASGVRVSSFFGLRLARRP